MTVIKLNNKGLTQQFKAVEHPIIKVRMETQPAEALTGEFSKQLKDFELAPTQTTILSKQISDPVEVKISEALVPNDIAVIDEEESATGT